MSIFMVLLFLSHLKAQSVPPAQLNVMGQEVVYKMEQQMADVIGEARAIRIYGDEKQELTAHKFVVYFGSTSSDKKKPPTSPPSSDDLSHIKIIKAFNDVRLKGNEREVRADYCTYYPPEEKIFCEGNVMIKDKANTLQGDKGEIDLNQKTYKILKGSQKAVQALIVPHKS